MMGVKQAATIEELPLDDRKRELFKARMTRQGEGVSQDGFSQDAALVSKMGGIAAATNINNCKRGSDSAEHTNSPGVGPSALTGTRDRKRKATPEKNRNAGPPQRWGSLNSLNDSNAENHVPRTNQSQPAADLGTLKPLTPPTGTRHNPSERNQNSVCTKNKEKSEHNNTTNNNNNSNTNNNNAPTVCTKNKEKHATKGLLSYFQPAQTSNSETSQKAEDKGNTHAIYNHSSALNNTSSNHNSNPAMEGGNSRGGHSRGGCTTGTHNQGRDDTGAHAASVTQTHHTAQTTTTKHTNVSYMTSNSIQRKLSDNSQGNGFSTRTINGFGNALPPPPKRQRTGSTSRLEVGIKAQMQASTDQVDLKIAQTNLKIAQPRPAAQAMGGGEERELQSHETDTIAEITQQLNEAKKSLEKQKRENSNLIRNGLELTMKNSALKEQVESSDQRNVRACTAIHQLLVDEYRRRRAELKKKTDENNLKLVAIALRRKGTELSETWVDGWAFVSAQARNIKLQERKKELESVKKARKALLTKKRAGTKAANGKGGDAIENGSDANDDYEDANLQDEILGLQKQQIAKEEKELMVELHTIEHERALHLRELKRQRDEAKSIYNDFRTINGRYLLLELLGKGGFSEVYKAYDFREMTFVACKLHVLNSQWTEEKQANYLKHAWREYQIHKDLRHPYIVSLLDVFELDSLNSFCTVLEYCEGSDLDFYLKHNKQMPEREARCVITQLFSALNYLNQIDPPVIHFDLKPANILYQNNEIKVTDFGLSKVMKECDLVNGDEMELTSQGAGTYWYLPPETFLMSSNVTISSKVDVWSAGVIFYQLLYGKRPFGDEMSQHSLKQHGIILDAREVKFPPRPVVSDDTKEFISLCLTYSKEARPDVLTMCRFPYLANGKR